MESISQTVLITGATSGIGYEISKLFAKAKYRIIIVGPESATLHNVSEVLKTLGARQVDKICIDLVTEQGAEELLRQIQKNNLQVEILVNDAASVNPGRFAESLQEKDLEVIYRNVVSMVKLTKYFIKQMKSRNSGKMVQLASWLSEQPYNMNAVVAASKAFVSSFTHSLAIELRSSEVKVYGLLPNASATGVPENAQFHPDIITIVDQDYAATAKIVFDTVTAEQPEIKPSVMLSAVKEFSERVPLEKNFGDQHRKRSA